MKRSAGSDGVKEGGGKVVELTVDDVSMVRNTVNMCRSAIRGTGHVEISHKGFDGAVHQVMEDVTVKMRKEKEGMLRYEAVLAATVEKEEEAEGDLTEIKFRTLSAKTVSYVDRCHILAEKDDLKVVLKAYLESQGKATTTMPQLAEDSPSLFWSVYFLAGSEGAMMGLQYELLGIDKPKREGRHRR